MLLSGCGGGGGGGSSSSVTGFLIDGAVEGVEYTCGSTTGLTGSDGAFSCTAFPVTFKIGSITLGSIATLPNDSKVLPQDLAGVDRNSTNDQKVLNVAQLLQSLDDDNNPNNGIKITSAIKAGFTQTINLQEQNSAQVQALVTTAGKTLVDSDTAKSHLESNTPGFVSQTPIVDTTAPSTPTLTTTPTTTTENSVIVEVNGEVGASIFVDGVDSSVVIASTGKANLTLDTSGADGDKIFAITLKDSSNNESTSLSLTIAKTTPTPADTTAPNAPTLTTTPTLTNQNSVTVEVNGEVGATIFVNTTDTNTDINASGKVNLDLNTSGADGIKNFSITLKDSANNESGALDINITKDTVAPTTFSWVYGIDGVGSLSNRMVTFDENVSETGLSISRSNGGTVSNIVVNDNNISFSYTKINTDENITIQGTDLAGNSFDITRGTKIILKTGQTTSYAANDDGAYQKGVSRSYTDNGDGTVTDNAIGLIWQKEDDDTQRNWADAGTYCSSLNLGSSTNWRLPTRKELYTLTDKSRVSPAIDPIFTNTNSTYYWSSTTLADVSSRAWYVLFNYGGADASNKTGTYYVRCVRDN